MDKEVEKLLVVLGQKLTGYSYLGVKPTYEVESSLETIKINGKDVPLNRKILNYKKIEYYLFGDGTKGLSKCIDDLSVNKGNYDAMLGVMNGYYGDVLKYASEMIPEDIELIEALIIRSAKNVNDKSATLFKKYDKDVADAEKSIQMQLSERQAKTLYDAENDKIVSATIYPHRNILGNMTGFVSISSRSLHNVDAEMDAHNYSANMMREITENSAREILYDKLFDMISDELTTFAVNFEDVFVVKRNDLFEKIDYRSTDIAICPYKYMSYIEQEKFDKEDYPNIKKVMKYYDILDDFIYDLENDIYLKMANTIDEDNKELYNGKNKDLYLYLTGKKEIKESANITEGLYSNYVAELKAMLDCKDIAITKDDVNRANEILNRANKNKEVFNDSQLAKIKELVNKVSLEAKNTEKEKKKNDPKKQKLRKRLYITLGIIIFWIIMYPIINDPEQYGQLLGIFFGILIVVGINCAIIKFIKKMRGY